MAEEEQDAVRGDDPGSGQHPGPACGRHSSDAEEAGEDRHHGFVLGLAGERANAFGGERCASCTEHDEEACDPCRRDAPDEGHRAGDDVTAAFHCTLVPRVQPLRDTTAYDVVTERAQDDLARIVCCAISRTAEVDPLRGVKRMVVAIG